MEFIIFPAVHSFICVVSHSIFALTLTNTRRVVCGSSWVVSTAVLWKIIKINNFSLQRKNEDERKKNFFMIRKIKKRKAKLFCELLPSLSSSLETKCPQLLSVESEREKEREGEGRKIYNTAEACRRSYKIGKASSSSVDDDRRLRRGRKNYEVHPTLGKFHFWIFQTNIKWLKNLYLWCEPFPFF